MTRHIHITANYDENRIIVSDGKSSVTGFIRDPFSKFKLLPVKPFCAINPLPGMKQFRGELNNLKIEKL